MKAETQRRRRRRRTAVTAAFGVLLIALAIFATLWRQSERAKDVAEQEARRATASQLFALARVEIERDPTAALAFARKSLDLYDTPDIRRFVLQLLWRGPVARILRLGSMDSGTQLNGFDLSPDGSRLAVFEMESNAVHLFPSDGGAPSVLPPPPDKNRSVLMFGPRGDLLVTGLANSSTLRVQSLPDLRDVRTIDAGGVITGVWVSGEELVTSSRRAEGEAHLLVQAWPLPEGNPRRLAEVDPSGLAEWTMDPRARWIAHLRDRTLHLRPADRSSRVPERSLGRLPDELWQAGYLRFWPSGNGLVTLENSGDIRLWPLDEGATAPSRVFRAEHGSYLLAVAGEPSRVARAGKGGAYVWELRDAPDVEPLILKELDSTGQLQNGRFDPAGQWLITTNSRRMSFWPMSLPRRRSLSLGATGISTWGVDFASNGRWLASCPIGEPARLWPMDARDGSFRDLLPAASCWGIAMHPAATHLLVGTWVDRQRGTLDGRVFLYPIDGGPPRQFRTGWEGELGTATLAIDPQGRRAVAAPTAADAVSLENPKRNALKEWDLETGAERSLPIVPNVMLSAYPFARYTPDGSVVYNDARGIVRFPRPVHPGDPASADVLFPSAGKLTSFALSRDGRQLLVLSTSRTELIFDELTLVDLSTRDSRRITTHGSRLFNAVFDPTGRYIVTGSHDGIVRVGPVTGEEPHLLVGHTGLVESLAVSADGRWIASAADDQLFLWPMPEMTKPPLHSLPHDELVAKLETLTNLRVVPDASATSGWKLDIGPFPGWKDVPAW